MVSNFVDAEARRAVLADRALACGDAPELQRSAQMIAEVFEVLCAAISVSDGARQRIVAGFGLDAGLADELETAMSRAASNGLASAVADLEDRQQRPGFIRCALIRSDTNILGCLAVADEAPRRFSARDSALMETLAAVALDQLYLVCVGRKLSDLGRRRLEEARGAAAQSRSLKRRLGQMARLGRIGGWMLDIESGQILWADDLPGRPEAGTHGQEGANVVSLAEHGGREAIRRAVRRTIDLGVPLEMEHPVQLPDGETRWVRMVGELEPGDGAAGRVIGIIQDVSERYRADEKISYLSQYDPLTGLPNRAVFQDRLQAAVRWAERARNTGAVLVLDIDGFSEINAMVGYQGGDAVLARLAERLSAVVRACDSVARLGGDRFSVAMVGTESAGDAMKLAERLLEATAEAMGEDLSGAKITASIGIALFPTNVSSATELLRSAEIALDRAKRAGGGSYAFFTAEMAAVADERRRLMSEVRAGLEAGQFVVAYQPKVDLRSDRLAGFEALIRWAHPERGLLSPGAFWEALSDPTLGKELSDTVLAEVVRQLSQWREAGVEAGPVAVNIAAGQLRDAGFLEQIRAVLDQWSVPASALRLEITEGVLLGRRSDRTVRALDGIHEIGIDTELDDFGTGYASLTHLRQFPVNRLKIDKSFVSELANPQNETIVRAVIEMAHGLNMEVIAEGVETIEVDRRLRDLGCDYGQGFFYSRPMAMEDVAPFVREWQQAVQLPSKPRSLVK